MCHSLTLWRVLPAMIFESTRKINMGTWVDDGELEGRTYIVKVKQALRILCSKTGQSIQALLSVFPKPTQHREISKLNRSRHY